MLDIKKILRSPASANSSSAGGRQTGREIGKSRSGRPIFGFCFGTGRRQISLIAGCHADEPVGPAMLDRLVIYLAGLSPDSSILSTFTWWIVPHANPDGEAANSAWTDQLPGLRGGAGRDLGAVDLPTYWRHVVREPPGEDMEFGFPRNGNDLKARPENLAIAKFLGAAGEISLHGSFHGMGFAAGPWFLIERSWADRTDTMRSELRRIVSERGYRVHDIDRHGDKGFHRIDRGFTSRPDSRAMIQHFEMAGDPETAALFRPSSMEWVQGQGGDPLTLVSEMPLFLLPVEAYETGDPVRPPMLGKLRQAFLEGNDALRQLCAVHGIEAMPFYDQMFFQLSFLDQALRTIVRQTSTVSGTTGETREPSR